MRVDLSRTSLRNIQLPGVHLLSGGNSVITKNAITSSKSHSRPFHHHGAMSEITFVNSIISLADRAIHLTRSCITVFDDAPAELRSALLQVTALRCILENIAFFSQTDPTNLQGVRDLNKKDRPLQLCAEALNKLMEMLPDEVTYNDNDGAFAQERPIGIQTQFAWPRESLQIQEITAELGRYKTALTLVLATYLV